ncbi:MAG: class I SAM-dependent methyltransferase [Acidobacteria bacterium]|jgi:SAM-dependent methyltransferase|nr:class I SAM-dependent methyltransferase [Acidobacteriota bacterium]
MKTESEDLNGIPGSEHGPCPYGDRAELNAPEAVRERRRTRRFFNLVSPAFILIDRRLLPEYRNALAELALNPALTVLDLGTGTGTLAGAFAERGHTVAGMDFARGLLRRARRRLPEAHLLEMDLAELPRLSDGAYDVVTMAYLLHGLPPELRRFTLCEAGRIARRFVLVFDYAAPVPWYVRAVEWIEGPHYPSFAARTTGDHGAEAGLEIRRAGMTSAFGGYWLAEPVHQDARGAGRREGGDEPPALPEGSGS